MAGHWRRALTGLALLSGVAGPSCAPQTPICERPEVLQEVGRVVRQWNIYNELDEATAREAPTTVANAVVCTATLITRGYDPTASGWQSQPLAEPLRYDVQVNGNRFYVQVAP